MQQMDSDNAKGDIRQFALHKLIGKGYQSSFTLQNETEAYGSCGIRDIKPDIFTDQHFLLLVSHTSKKGKKI
jgi:hypothetical protein